MPSELFQLTTVTRLIGDGVELSEAIGFPEVSALDDAERKWRACLQAKAKGILEAPDLIPAYLLHRRRLGRGVEADEIEIVFQPPKRLPQWEKPVNLRIGYVRWEEAGLFHGYVPGIGVHAFATGLSLLTERVKQHVQLVLLGRRKYITLQQLAELARIESLRLTHIDVTATLKTPRQIAEGTESVNDKPSSLEKLADQLPPIIARTSGTAGSQSIPQAAFEMEPELQTVAEALAGLHRSSVLLVGPPGCGKTALVRELARRRHDFGFGHTAFWSTSGARLMTGPIGFGMWQERCQEMCREISKAHAILHLNNLAELLEVGKATRGEQSVGSFLRPWIARGEVLAIAECTPEQFAALERREPHLVAAFSPITIAERTPEETRAILEKVFEAAPGKPPRDPGAALASLDWLHQLHRRYATYSANPGRPLRFLRNLLADRFPDKELAEAQVTAVFSRETGLPTVLLDDAMTLDLERTRGWFARRVIGQSEAVSRVVDLLALIKARLARPRKPLASFLFIGPTGTGKTEMAKAMAEFLFSDAARMVRFDLNEFSNPQSVQRLIGGPACGDAEGLLTARVREQPFSVVLLDEFEKADASFFDLLLQVLGDGRLTDGVGRVADFCNSVIIMTSNLGAQGFQQGAAGFRPEDTVDPREHFASAVQNFLRPETFNRLDAVVPFAPLTREVVLNIARRHVELVLQRDGVRLRGIECDLSPEVAEHLAERGYSPRYGARPLKRAIERELLVPLAEALNQYEKSTPLAVQIGVREGRIHLHARARVEAGEAEARARRSEQDFAVGVVEQRRSLAKLQHCPMTAGLENQVTMLESLERRLKTAKWKSPAHQARMGVLPELRACLAGLGALAQRCRALETEVLAALHMRDALDRELSAPELHSIERERQRLLRLIFRLQYEDADNVVMAFYSEDRGALFEFAAAYRTLGGRQGEVKALEYLRPPPGARSNVAKLLRETPKDIDKFFGSPPEKVIGIVMHLHGDLFLPQFAGEAGLHIVKDKKVERICLVETAVPPIDKYEPPAGIDRAGAIQGKGAAICRTFIREKDMVNDRALGERPWTATNVAGCAAALIEERLDRAIKGMVDA
jgi:ATP-dependent Clp protease ATP-binding subunit ClpC